MVHCCIKLKRFTFLSKHICTATKVTVPHPDIAEPTAVRYASARTPQLRTCTTRRASRLRFSRPMRQFLDVSRHLWEGLGVDQSFDGRDWRPSPHFLCSVAFRKQQVGEQRQLAVRALRPRHCMRRLCSDCRLCRRLIADVSLNTVYNLR